MRNMFIKLSLVAAVLAFNSFYQSPLQAQEKDEIEADGEANAEREEELLRERQARERGRAEEDLGEPNPGAPAPEAPAQDAGQMMDEPAAGGCTLSGSASAGPSTYSFLWGAAVLTLVIRQRNKA